MTETLRVEIDAVTEVLLLPFTRESRRGIEYCEIGNHIYENFIIVDLRQFCNQKLCAYPPGLAEIPAPAESQELM